MTKLLLAALAVLTSMTLFAAAPAAAHRTGYAHRHYNGHIMRTHMRRDMMHRRHMMRRHYRRHHVMR